MAPERAVAAMLKDGGTEFSPRDVVAFTKLAEGVASATTLEEVLWAVAHEALGTMQLEDVVIYLVDQTRGVCVQAAAYGPKNPEGRTIKAPLEIPLGKGVVGRVARTGEAALVPDVSVDPDYIPDDVARLSELTVPIIADGEVLGVIDSEHSVAGFFTPRHQTVFTAIARLAAPRIEQFVLRARLEAAGDARLQAQVQRLERRFAREQRARREAERLLETKSRELFDLNQSLAQRASGLQAQLLESTGETVRIREIYQTVLDRLPFQLGIFDVEGVYTYVNPAAIADPTVREWIIGKSNREYGTRRGLPEAVIAERDALIRQVAATGTPVEFDESFTTKAGELRWYRRTIAPITDAEGRETANVIGYLPGDDGSRGADIVVVSAHLDHLGNGRLGANDNASGVAGLLSIAQSLAEGPRPARTVVFAAFGSEESGMEGATVFMDSPPAEFEPSDVVYNVNMDMIGTYSATDIVYALGALRGTAGRAAVAARRADYPELDVGLDEPSDLSDNYAFCSRGVPYLFFWTEDPDCYHEACDTADRLDYTSLVEIARLTGQVTGDLADSEADLRGAVVTDENVCGG